jgi:hypothetical protein
MKMQVSVLAVIALLEIAACAPEGNGDIANKAGQERRCGGLRVSSANPYPCCPVGKWDKPDGSDAGVHGNCTLASWEEFFHDTGIALPRLTATAGGSADARYWLDGLNRSKSEPASKDLLARVSVTQAPYPESLGIIIGINHAVSLNRELSDGNWEFVHEQCLDPTGARANIPFSSGIRPASDFDGFITLFDITEGGSSGGAPGPRTFWLSWREYGTATAYEVLQWYYPDMGHVPDGIAEGRDPPEMPTVIASLPSSARTHSWERTDSPRGTYWFKVRAMDAEGSRTTQHASSTTIDWDG